MILGKGKGLGMVTDESVSFNVKWIGRIMLLLSLVLLIVIHPRTSDFATSLLVAIIWCAGVVFGVTRGATFYLREKGK